MENGEVVEYKVVTEKDPWKLESEVNKLLDGGWELYGSIFLLPPSEHEREPRYVQPMIKRKGT